MSVHELTTECSEHICRTCLFENKCKDEKEEPCKTCVYGGNVCCWEEETRSVQEYVYQCLKDD